MENNKNNDMLEEVASRIRTGDDVEEMIRIGDIEGLLKNEMRKAGYTTYIDIDGKEKSL